MKIKPKLIKAGLVVLLCLAMLIIIFVWRQLSPDGKKIVSVSSGYEAEGVALINGTTGIGTIDDDFICATLDWWPSQKCDYGTCSWGNASLFSLDLKNSRLFHAIRAFSPLKVRLGGSLQDKITYETPGYPCQELTQNTSEMFGFSEGCLPVSRWDEINDFFHQTGAVVIFGLNALTGRAITSDGLAVGEWDSSNAESLIRYSVRKGYKIHGWELGNELGGNAIGAAIVADQYAKDTNKLQSLIQTIYAEEDGKPIILAPGGFFEEKWFTEFLQKTNGLLQAVTHHIYTLGPGNDPHLIEKILDPVTLDEGSTPYSFLQGILERNGASTVAWVGEAGGAYNSGHHNVTDTFAFSFWYLDQLGMASTYDTKTYCRQTLIGGNYGLINAESFEPHPDFYSALLWHRLMGRKVLSVSFLGTTKIRVYAHCSKRSRGITVLLINLSNDTTVYVHTAEKSEREVATATRHYQRRRGRLNRAPGANTRDEYHLTAKDGNIQSATILLNGKKLTPSPGGEIPVLEPVKAHFFDPITVVPLSIVFAQMANLTIPVCEQEE